MKNKITLSLLSLIMVISFGFVLAMQSDAKTLCPVNSPCAAQKQHVCPTCQKSCDKCTCPNCQTCKQQVCPTCQKNCDKCTCPNCQTCKKDKDCVTCPRSSANCNKCKPTAPVVKK